MSGTLYGPIASPNVARSAVVAKELNIPLKYQLVDLLKGEHKQEPFISLNVSIFFFFFFSFVHFYTIFVFVY